MKPDEFSAAQLAQLSTLIENGNLKSVAMDLEKAHVFLAQAAEVIDDFVNVKSAGVLYDMSCNACHAVGEAMLSAYGYRTNSREGQHAILGEFLGIVFANTSAQEATQNFDGLRRSRNARQYEARPVGNSQATLAVKTAKELFKQGFVQVN